MERLTGSCLIMSRYYWGMHPVKMARVKREYKRLYPSGRVDILRRLLQYAAFAFLVLLLIPLGFFK